jgi:hypothetical protein
MQKRILPETVKGNVKHVALVHLCKRCNRRASRTIHNIEIAEITADHQKMGLSTSVVQILSLMRGNIAARASLAQFVVDTVACPSAWNIEFVDDLHFESNGCS